MRMRTLNYILAVASIVVGITLSIFAFAIDGLSTTLGVMLGILLIINGALRLWLLLKQKGHDGESPMSCEGD